MVLKNFMMGGVRVRRWWWVVGDGCVKELVALVRFRMLTVGWWMMELKNLLSDGWLVEEVGRGKWMVGG